MVLIADTDTHNPDPAVYATLLDRLRAGAALAITDPRHWDEANLTNHLARPMIAAATSHDAPQPLADDLVSRRPGYRGPSAELAACVDGYGSDTFLLLTAAAIGPAVSGSMGPSSTPRTLPAPPGDLPPGRPRPAVLAATWTPRPPRRARCRCRTGSPTARSSPPA
ncbi:hypothetical protein AB0G85_37010 [Streptomyces sioyaensis]|uniref:hypothetical protein n=1 Tax=Streptomyces sioyaensis TaxID=67364 RepID=UPI0033FBFEC4